MTANPSFLERLTFARDLIRDGMSLSLAARAVGMTRDELDMSLWNAMGSNRPCEHTQNLTEVSTVSEHGHFPDLLARSDC